MFTKEFYKDYIMSTEELELRLLEIQDDLIEERNRRQEELDNIVDSLTEVLNNDNSTN